MQNAARPDIDIQTDLANRRAVSAVMQRRIDMGAGMGRQGDASDIHRTLGTVGPDALLPEWRITRPGRCFATQGWTDVPQRCVFCHRNAHRGFRVK
ncbi:hypothetical protein D3C72_1850950 [compost metagenome]